MCIIVYIIWVCFYLGIDFYVILLNIILFNCEIEINMIYYGGKYIYIYFICMCLCKDFFIVFDNGCFYWDIIYFVKNNYIKLVWGNL